MKRCTKCEQVKQYSEFNKANTNADGYFYICKLCRKEDYQKNRGKILLRVKNYRENNKEKLKKREKVRREQNKESIKVYQKRYSKENAEIAKKRAKGWYKKNKEYVRLQGKIYRQKNKDIIAIRRKNNIEKRRECRNNWARNKKQADPIFKLKHNIKTLILIHLKNKGFSKTSKTCQILGCDYEFLHKYLNETFFKNYNRYPTLEDQIHIDHIIPLATAKTGEEALKLNHYTNLQWLLASDNLKKGDSLDWSLNV